MSPPETLARALQALSPCGRRRPRPTTSPPRWQRARRGSTWRTALVGLPALGAGTGYGLGLLVPVPD